MLKEQALEKHAHPLVISDPVLLLNGYFIDTHFSRRPFGMNTSGL